MAKKKIPSSFDAGSSNVKDLYQSSPATLAAPGSGDAGLQADEETFYAENPQYEKQSPEEGDGFAKRDSQQKLEEGSYEAQESSDALLAQQENERMEREAQKQISQNAMLDGDPDFDGFRKRESEKSQAEADRGVAIIETEQDRKDKAREAHSKEYDKQEFIDEHPEQAYTDSQGKRHLINPDFSKSNFDYQFALGNVDEGQEKAYDNWKATGEVNPLLLGMEVEQEQFEFEQKRNAQMPEYVQGNSLLEGIHNTFNVAFPTAIKGSLIASQGFSTQKDGKELDRLKLGLEDGTYLPGTEVIEHKRGATTSRPGGGRVSLIPIEDRIKYLEKKRRKTNAHILDGIGDLKELEKAAEGYNNPEIFDEDGLTVKDFGGIVGRQVPQMLVSMTTFGLGAFGQEFGGAYADNLKAIAAKKYDLDLEAGEEPTKEQMLAVIDAGEDQLGVALATGAVSGGLEFVGAKGAGSLLVKNGFFKNAVKKNAIRVLKSRGLAFTGDTLGEALTEASQSIVSQYGSHKALEKEEDFELDWAEIKESAGQGLIGGLGLSGPRHAYGGVKSKIKKEAGKLQGEINRAVKRKDGTTTELTDADRDAITPSNVEGSITNKQNDINLDEEALQDAQKRGDVEAQKIIVEQHKEDVAARAEVETENTRVIDSMSDAEIDSQLSSADQIANLTAAADRANTPAEKKVLNKKLNKEKENLKRVHNEVKNWDTNVETAQALAQQYDTKNEEHKQKIKDLKDKEYVAGSKEHRQVKELEDKIAANTLQQEAMWKQFETERPTSIEGSIVQATNSKPTKSSINKIKAHRKSTNENRGSMKALTDKVESGDLTNLTPEESATLGSVANTRNDVVDGQVGQVVSNATKDLKGDLNTTIKSHNDTRSALTGAVSVLRQIVSGATAQADGKKVSKKNGKIIASTLFALNNADGILEQDAQASLNAVISGNKDGEWNGITSNPKIYEALEDVKNVLIDIDPDSKAIAAIEKIQAKKDRDVVVKLQKQIDGEAVVFNEVERGIAKKFATETDPTTGKSFPALKSIPLTKEKLVRGDVKLAKEHEVELERDAPNQKATKKYSKEVNQRDVSDALADAGYAGLTSSQVSAIVQEIKEGRTIQHQGDGSIHDNPAFQPRATRVWSNDETVINVVRAADNLREILNVANKAVGIGKENPSPLTPSHERINVLAGKLEGLINIRNRELGQAKLMLQLEKETLEFADPTVQLNEDTSYNEEGDFEGDFEPGRTIGEDQFFESERTNAHIGKLETRIATLEAALINKSKEADALINTFIAAENSNKTEAKSLEVQVKTKEELRAEIKALETEQAKSPVKGKNYDKLRGQLKSRLTLLDKKKNTVDKTAKGDVDVIFEEGISQEQAETDKVKLNKWVKNGQLYKFFEQDLQNGIVNREGKWIVEKVSTRNRLGIPVSKSEYKFVPTGEVSKDEGVASKLRKFEDETFAEYDARKAARRLVEGKTSPELTEDAFNGKDTTLKILQLMGVAKKEAQKAIHNRNVQPVGKDKEIVLADSDFYGAAFQALVETVNTGKNKHGKDIKTVKEMISAVKNNTQDAVNAFADNLNDVVIPGDVKDLRNIISKANNYFTGRVGRAATIEELSILIEHRQPVHGNGHIGKVITSGKKKGQIDIKKAGQGNVKYVFPGQINPKDPAFTVAEHEAAAQQTPEELLAIIANLDEQDFIAEQKAIKEGVDPKGTGPWKVKYPLNVEDRQLEVRKGGKTDATTESLIAGMFGGAQSYFNATGESLHNFYTGPIVDALNFAQAVSTPTRLDGLIESDGDIVQIESITDLQGIRTHFQGDADVEVLIEKVRAGKQAAALVLGDKYAMLIDKVGKIMKGLPVIKDPDVIDTTKPPARFQFTIAGKKKGLVAPIEIVNVFKKIYEKSNEVDRDIKAAVSQALLGLGLNPNSQLTTFNKRKAEILGLRQGEGKTAEQIEFERLEAKKPEGRRKSFVAVPIPTNARSKQAFADLVKIISADAELAAIYTGKVRDIQDVYYGSPIVKGEVKAAKEFWNNADTVAYEAATENTVEQNLEIIEQELGVEAKVKAVKEGVSTIKAHKKQGPKGKSYTVNERTQQFTELKEGKDVGMGKAAKDIDIMAHKAKDTKKEIKTLTDKINKDLKLKEFEFRPGFGPQKVLKSEGKKRLSNIDNKTRQDIGKIKELMISVKNPTPQFLKQVQSAINATMLEGYARATAKHKSIKAENEALASEASGHFLEDLSDEKKNATPTDVKIAKRERSAIDGLIGNTGQVSGKGTYAKIANFITSPRWDHHYGLLERILPSQAGPLREAAKKFLNDNYTEELKIAMYQSQEAESSMKEDYDALLVEVWGERKSTAQKLGIDKGVLGSEALVFKSKSAGGRAYLTEGSGVFVNGDQLSNSQVVALVNYAKDPTLHSKLIAGGITLEKISEMADYINSEGQEQLKRFSAKYPTLFADRRAQIDAKLDAEGVKGVEGDVYINIAGNKDAYNAAKKDNTNVREFTPDQASLDILDKVYDGQIPTKSVYTPFRGAQTEASVDLDFDVFNKAGDLDATSVISENLSARSETGAVDWLGLSVEDLVNNYATGTMRSISFLKFSRKAAQIFNKKNLRKLEISQGKDWVDAYKKQIGHLITGRRPSASGNIHPGLKWVDRWLSRGTALIMAVNPKSAILQTTSSLNFIVEDPSIIDTKDNFFGKDFTEAQAIIKNSGFYKLRGATNTDVMIDQIGNQQGYAGTKTIDNWLQKGLFLTKFADKGAIAKGGAPYVANQMRKGRAQTKQEGNKFSGMTDLQIQAEVMKEFQLLARQSQQDSSADNLGADQTTMFGKYTGSFMNATAQYMRNISSALRKIQAGEDVARNSGRVFNYGVFAPLAFAAMSGAMANALSFNDDDEEDNEKDQAKKQNYVVGLIDTFMTSMGPWRALLFNVGASAVASYDEGFNRDGSKKSDKQSKKYVGAFLNEFANLVPMVSHRLRMIRIATAEKRTYAQSEENLGWLSDITGEDPASLRRVFAGIEGGTPIPTWRLYSWISAIEDQFADDLDLIDKIQRIGGFSRYALQENLPDPKSDGFNKRGGGSGFSKRKKGNDGFKKRGTSEGEFSKRGASEDDGFSETLPFNRDAPLQAGVAGEAHKDGTIKLSPGLSPEEREKTIAHEMDHKKRMDSGQLGYTDKHVMWDGKKYPRKDGKIKFNGRWLKEGHKQFPWEKKAYAAEDKGSPTKRTLKDLYKNN